MPSNTRDEPAASAFQHVGRGIDVALLATLLVLLGVVLIPSHWTSIWMDREFTGTVAAIANRLTGGVRLYAEGGHIPMPPLPFLAVHLLTAGHATWLWESALNFGFQTLALAFVYLTLARLFARPVPFLATLVTIPTFLAIHKSVLYDSMAQAAVALLLFQTVVHLGSPRGSRGTRGWLPGVVGLAATSAAALLVKQSTAAGACIGVVGALLACGRGTLRERLARAAAYLSLTVIVTGGLTLALAPWADPIGLVRDVFVSGAEPKGGVAPLLANLVRFAVDIGKHAVALLPLLAIVATTARLVRGRRTAAPGASVSWAPPVLLVVGAAVSAAGLCALFVAGPWTPITVLSSTVALPPFLWLGLFLAVLLGLRRYAPRFLHRLAGPGSARSLAGAVAVAFAAALFHSLSTNVFRWSYDNNPLVAIAYGALFQVALALLGTIPSRWARPALVAALCFVAVPMRPWARLADQLLACRRCTERWEEVRHLAGARLRPSAAGMRALVATVRREAGPGGEVLLLPNDPNVEAWFERPRPVLSSLFVFADQYWDRYVDADVAALATQPPRVIVLGPVGYWRGFHRLFKVDRGAERFVDRVVTELLPSCYRLVETAPILYQGRPDSMEVYVLRR